MSEEYRRVPTVALRGMTILPGMVAHFDVSRNRSIKAIENAMVEDQTVFLITQKNVNKEDPTIEDLYSVGVFAVIKQVIKLQNNVVRVLIEGEQRGRLVDLSVEECLFAEIEVLKEEEEELPDTIRQAMMRGIKETFGRYCILNPKPGKELAKQMQDIQDLGRLLDDIGNNLPVPFEDKQKILEARTTQERYETLMIILMNEINVIQIKTEFQSKVKEKVDKNQKEYILREQMRLIREELGEDNTVSEADHFLEETENLDAEQEVKDKLKKEIERFKNVSSNSSESAVIRGYIETLLELPWNKASKDNKNLGDAERILDEDHYGMEKVKERMLEFLAVRNLTAKGDSPIICLVGPPGTGKTSIARSVARALDKKYVRISLGGVRDEAEIRGHRKTYVGAMPGRIATGLKNSGVKNPLMLLDEIDKISSDYKGDTASALLEVLDSEQNSRFRDHYVEIPIDLSEVLFIATANSLQDIQKPLLDRMEIIEVSSYTENEKAHIAREHLIAKQMEKNGLKPGQLSISDRALERLIRGYTREAGVRNLERKIGEICRKAARELYNEEFSLKQAESEMETEQQENMGKSKKKVIKVTDNRLEKLLGKEKYSYDIINENDEVGIVRGLAWTSVGGDTLQIEVNIMPGKGEFQLTGQLGDVMKESAQAGISYIRSVSEQYQIDKEFFKEYDIHIHIPEGAVPKDGPSAGITMATAMLSAITKRKVRKDVAMTGEITLRGRVLPIGGLKEKILAAKNAGIKTVCVPKKNEPDIGEISQEIKKGLEIVFVENMEQVLETALVK